MCNCGVCKKCRDRAWLDKKKQGLTKPRVFRSEFQRNFFLIRRCFRKLKGAKKWRETYEKCMQKRANKEKRARREAAIVANIHKYGKDKAIRIQMYIKKKREGKWRYTDKDLKRYDRVREKYGWFNPFQTADNTPLR